MKQNFKNYLKLGIFLFGISAIMSNCEKESLKIDKVIEKSAFDISKISLNDFKNKDKVFEKISSLMPKKKKNSLRNRMIYDSINDFYVDTDNVYLIQVEDYHWLTFPILREESISGVENLVLKYNVDSETYSAYLVYYDFSEEDIEILENSEYVSLIDKSTFIPLDNFDSTEILNETSREIHESPLGYCYIEVEQVSQATGWTIIVQQEVPCNDGGGVNDGGNDDGNDWQWNDNQHDDENDGSYNGGGNGTNEGGENNTNLPDNLGGAVVTLPNMARPNRECKKIINLLSENPNYKQKLLDLSTTINQDHENAFGTYEDGSEFNISGNSNTIQVKLNDNPNSSYTSLAHTHFEFIDADGNSIKTYSIFSIGDLQFLANRAKENELNTRDFVAFLITGKGTRYALTIKSKTKFIGFFKYLDLYNKALDNSISLDEFNILHTYYINEAKPLLDKYYDNDNPPAPIKVENTDNNKVLLEFLKFMNEADLGISLFSVDANFENFEELSLNSASTIIEKQNCNN